MPAQTAKTPGSGSGTISYTLASDSFDVESVYASIDATAAAGPVTAELTVQDQSGVVIARKKQTVTIPAGATGSATWALRLDDEGGAAGYDTVQDEGVPLTQRTTLDFVGSGVVASDDAANARTVVTVPSTGYGLLGTIFNVLLGAPQNIIDSNTILGGVLPVGFSHLLLYAVGKVDALASEMRISVRFNADAGNNYNDQYVENATATTVTAGEETIVTGGLIGRMPAANVTGPFTGSLELRVFDYGGTTFYKHAHADYYSARSTSASAQDRGVSGVQWANTAAITRIQIRPVDGSNFIAGSRFTLYGLP